MTVIQSTISSVKPGRFDGMVALAHEAEKVFERHGASAVRLLEPAAAGDATGTSTFSVEYPDIEAWGRASDELGNDPDLVSLISRLRAPDSPVTMLQQSLGIEVPGRTPKNGRGDVLEVHVTRVSPGRLEQAMADGFTACDVMERAGAVNARLFSINYAGAGTNLTFVSFEFPDMRTQAKAQQAWQSDEDGLRLAQSINAERPVTTLVYSALYRVIPL